MCTPVLLQEQSLIIPYYLGEPDMHILLGKKQRGFGIGKLVFPGGKPAGDESSKEIAARELSEETGIVRTPSDLRFLGRLVLKNDDQESQVHIYGVQVSPNEFSRELTPKDSSDLAHLQWLPPDKLDLSQMPPDYAGWLPIALALLETNHTDNIQFLSRISRMPNNFAIQQTMLIQGDRVSGATAPVQYYET